VAVSVDQVGVVATTFTHLHFCLFCIGCTRRYGATNNKSAKLSPDIVAWESLSARKQQLRVWKARLQLLSIHVFQFQLGLAADNRDANKERSQMVALLKASTQPKQNKDPDAIPDPVQIDGIILPRALSTLAEVMAQNLHETWFVSRASRLVSMAAKDCPMSSSLLRCHL